VLGIASIDGLGPRGSGFHTKDECIELGTLVPKAQALARFLALRGVA
jgi:glutamate carboxypeptidase